MPPAKPFAEHPSEKLKTIPHSLHHVEEKPNDFINSTDENSVYSYVDNTQAFKDKIKELEEERLENEKALSIFNGALDFLSEQLTALRYDSCPVCYRSHQDEESWKICKEQIQLKIKHTIAERDKLDLVNKHKICVRNLAETKAPSYQDRNYQSRMNFNMRMGALTELRNQKIECLVAKRCFACDREFTNTESTIFLSKVDHMAAVMEKELHIHT